MDCIEAARDADPEPQRQMFHSAAGDRRASRLILFPNCPRFLG